MNVLNWFKPKQDLSLKRMKYSEVVLKLRKGNCTRRLSVCVTFRESTPSNNHINDLITTPLDFMDEDVVSQYISFLKLLSMNLTSDTVQFFYNYVVFSSLCDSRRSLRTPSLSSPSVASSMTIPSPWFVSLCERSR